MNILKSWLKDYVKIDQSDEELSDLLSFSGTLVEEVTGAIDENIIVAKILEISSHPNADRLRLVKLTDGKDEIRVVCGGKNIEIGQMVPLAKIGARVGEIIISEAEIRGEKSYGMLCSGRDLGLSDDHDGIFILPDDYELGKPLKSYVNSDSVFELEITPNRGDCLSHLGVAREVVALSGQKLEFSPETSSKEKNSGDLKIEIKDPETCFKYAATVVRGVKIAPSPDWLIDRLKKVGLKSINNVVDITNYVMMDLGQPLHAFDKDKISGEKIIIRRADQGEKITTIDEVERELDQEMLVIADHEKSLAIAGVMGGLESAIGEKTSDIVLESAIFERRSVRRTSKVLSLVTDASYRFERGIDANLVEVAIFKAAKMIEEIAGGKIDEYALDLAREEKNDFVKVEYEKINGLLGLALTESEIDRYLSLLGFEMKNGMALSPSWRHDIEIWQDLAEEVARLYGLSKIPLSEMEKSPAPSSADYYYREAIKDIISQEGFVEVLTYPFLSQSDLSTIGLTSDDLLEVANPVQSENKYMRNSLIPALMRTVAKNPTFDPVLVFEVGNVFDTKGEVSKIALAASGKNAKRIIEDCVGVLVEGTGLGADGLKIKEFSREDLSKYKIKKPSVYVLEFNSDEAILAMREKGIKVSLSVCGEDAEYREISKFPPVKRDLAFVVKNEVSKEDITKQIKLASEKAVLVEAFDEFVSDKFTEGSKSIAFHIWLEDRTKTLSDKEADEQINEIIKSLVEKFSVKLRD